MIETIGLGGAEMVLLQLAKELRERGHVIHPIVPAGQAGWLLDRFDEHAFHWELYDPKSPIDLAAPRRLAKTLSRLRVDVVHSHEFVMAVFGTAASLLARLPHVISMHGNQEMTRRFRRRLALRWAFRRSRATVAVSHDTRKHLEDTLGLRSGVVQVVHNGMPNVPGDRNRIRRELALGADELLLLAVGSLVPRKGHSTLLNALAEVARRGVHRRWRLAIAGVGDEHTRLDVLISSLNLQGRVHLLGPRNDVPDLQAAADVFVMPSLWEGLPLAIIEAMFAGNAIVASRTSGIPEAIVHDRHGLLTDPGNVTQLADALQAVMRDRELRERLGRSARDRAESEFTVKVMTDRYEALYRGTKPA